MIFLRFLADLANAITVALYCLLEYYSLFGIQKYTVCYYGKIFLYGHFYYFCSDSIIRCMCNVSFFVFYEYYAIIIIIMILLHYRVFECLS